MNTMKLAAAVVLGLCALGVTDVVLAHGVNARQATQQGRIQHGVAQGDLTRREAVVLQHQQTHIARNEARMRRDGALNPVERVRLDAQQDRASRANGEQRHDAQRR